MKPYRDALRGWGLTSGSKTLKRWIADNYSGWLEQAKFEYEEYAPNHITEVDIAVAFEAVRIFPKYWHKVRVPIYRKNKPGWGWVPPDIFVIFWAINGEWELY